MPNTAGYLGSVGVGPHGAFRAVEGFRTGPGKAGGRRCSGRVEGVLRVDITNFQPRWEVEDWEDVRHQFSGGEHGGGQNPNPAKRAKAAPRGAPAPVLVDEAGNDRSLVELHIEAATAAQVIAGAVVRKMPELRQMPGPLPRGVVPGTVPGGVDMAAVRAAHAVAKEVVARKLNAADMAPAAEALDTAAASGEKPRFFRDFLERIGAKTPVGFSKFNSLGTILHPTSKVCAVSALHGGFVNCCVLFLLSYVFALVVF